MAPTHRQASKQTNKQTNTDRQKDRQTNRHTEKQTSRLCPSVLVFASGLAIATDRHIDRQTDRQTERGRQRDTILVSLSALSSSFVFALASLTQHEDKPEKQTSRLCPSVLVLASRLCPWPYGLNLQTSKQTNKQAGRQADRQTDRQRERDDYPPCPCFCICLRPCLLDSPHKQTNEKGIGKGRLLARRCRRC